MRILMVTPYPPQRDGIANYAAQAVASLMRQGHEVVVLSPQPSAAHLHLDFMSGPRAWAAMARRVRGFDKLVIQWHPAFFYRSGSVTDRSAIDVAMAAVFRLVPEVEIWVHEYEYAEVTRSATRRRAARLAFSQVDRLVFHSERERELFLEVVPMPQARTVVEEHGQAFRRRTSMTREQARASLDIADDAFVYLCIGFIQRHKGFDRAVRAFASLDAPTARLDIVGSTRLDEPEFLTYLSELEWLADQDERTRLHTGYVSDELFDRWILASDLVVLPYREIWSSGVLERAALFDRPVVASRVGGLEQQAGSRDVVFVDDDAGLVEAMARAAGVQVRSAADTATGALEGKPWEELQDTVVQRAALARGSARRVAQPPAAGASTREVEPVDRASAMVRRLPPYVVPPATSTRPGAPLVKRLIQRLTMWEITPLAAWRSSPPSCGSCGRPPAPSSGPRTAAGPWPTPPRWRHPGPPAEIRSARAAPVHPRGGRALRRRGAGRPVRRAPRGRTATPTDFRRSVPSRPEHPVRSRDGPVGPGSVREAWHSPVADRRRPPATGTLSSGRGVGGSWSTPARRRRSARDDLP